MQKTASNAGRRRGTCDKLHQDAADAPDVSGKGPAEAQDHLRGSVVPRAHDLAVVLVLKGCAAKVDHLDVAGPRHPDGLPATVTPQVAKDTAGCNG